MKNKVTSYLTIVIGNILLAIAVAFFSLPFDIDGGGLAGISVVLQSVLNWDPGVVIFIANWVLFIVGAIVFKKEFAIKTLVSTIVYPIAVLVIRSLPIYEEVTSQINDPLLATLFAGILTGVALGIVYKAGGSTGGLDVIVLILKKYCHFKISISTFCIDATIVTLGLLVSINSSLYGIVTIVLSSLVIEQITVGGSSSYMMHIISEEYEAITKYIIEDLERGCTILDVEGGINRDKRKMIEVLLSDKEYYRITNKISEIDKDAFISIYKAKAVLGNGFEIIGK